MERKKPTEPSYLQGKRRILEATIQDIKSRSKQPRRNLDEERKLINSLNRTVSGKRLTLKSVRAETLLIGTEARDKKNFLRPIPRVENVEPLELSGGAEPRQPEPIFGVAIGSSLTNKAQPEEWYLVCGSDDLLLIPLTGIEEIRVELSNSRWHSLKAAKWWPRH